MIIRPSGPANAKIAIVGEAPGAEEEASGQPFVGTSGWCLTSMLKDAGIDRNEVFITNLCYERPPSNDITAWISDRKTQPSPEWTRLHGKWVAPQVLRGYKQLIVDLEAVKPNIVIALGGTAMWALTGKEGISNWRGSQLSIDTEEMKQWL